MIFAPPRHTKSELASRRFPAWYLGRNPDKQLICATYSGDFALDFGRDVRGIVNSEEYQRLFDTTISQDSRAANRWHTDQGGISVYVGVGGPITGRGAHVALIDDPFKNREEADSELRRETVWRWYTSTLRTRLMPHGAIVLILTRWHEDDLAGRLLDTQGDQWEVVNLQAETDGEALWPEWYPIDVLMEIKNDIGTRDWEALYQQQPRPEQGTYFQREWFRWYEDNPNHLNIFVSTDFAVTERDGDWTEFGVFGVDPDGNIYILDWWSGQSTADVWIDSLLDLVTQYKPLAVFGEAGPIRRAIEPFLMRRMRERKAYFRMEWVVRNRDKAAMARAFQARAAAGKVYLKTGQDDVLNQLLSFPAGRHDDKVDVCGLIGLVLDETHPATVTRRDQTRPKRRDYGINYEGEESWKTV